MIKKMMNMAATQTLADVNTNEMRIQALEFATYKMELATRSPHLRTAIETIYLELQRQLNDAHSRLLLWGVMLDGQTKHTARRMAYKRFLREGRAIMQYLEPDADLPMRYSVADYEEFRDELDVLKAEIEAEDSEDDREWSQT